jgi:hypothetical protein
VSALSLVLTGCKKDEAATDTGATTTTGDAAKPEGG